MAIMEILKEPNPTLRQVSEPVDPSTINGPETQQFIDDLIESMHVSNGIGIAAPQTGIHKRLIIVNLHGRAQAFINPILVAKSFRKGESEEGCLSVPGVYGIVKRHKKVKVKALDRHGKAVTLSIDGLMAIVFQHEIDHLDGILFIDKVERYTSVPRL